MRNRIRNFEIQTKLGSGSYGVIYKALDKSTRQVCVLKQISLGRLSQKARKNAVNEATIMGKLIHPFVVRYRQSFIEEGTLNIVMEFCEAGDLSMFLKGQNRKPLKEERIWKFFIEICVGLEYIHRNKILHRDIKTLNIFMNKGEELKIGDLGVAKMLTSNEFAQTMVGTPFYLSPELCEEKPYNEKSDVWALGCLLYELCTFRHPFEAQNQASLILKIIRGKYLPIPEHYSPELRELIDLCLERDYKRRPTTSNLLARPKVQFYYAQLGIDRIIEEYMANVRKEKEKEKGKDAVVQVKPAQQLKGPPPQQPKIVKALDQPRKQAKKQEAKKEQIKKEEPRIILPPKPMAAQGSQKKIDVTEKRNNLQENMPRRESKNEFVANLERMIDDSNKKGAIKQSPSYAEVPQGKPKEDRYQKIAVKVEEIKKDQKIGESKTPNLQDNRKFTPQIPEKKPATSLENIPSAKKQEPSKPAAKPPMPPPAQGKEQAVIKVKAEKVVQAKVYDSQKNVAKPQGIIKSGGFNPALEVPAEKLEKPIQHSNSKDKPIERNLVSAKRPSVPGIIKQEKLQGEEVKQLFGLLPSPTLEHKSEKNLKNLPASEEAVRGKNDLAGNAVNVSRVRKGGPNVLSRNARNVSRYNEISKEEKDEVMNLPTKPNNRGHSSSDSQDEPSRPHVIDDLRARTNRKFKLKEINDELVLQKYEDLMKSEQAGPQEEESEGEIETSREFQRKINEDIKQDYVLQPSPQQEEEIGEDLERNSASDDQIEEMLQSELQDENLEKEENLEQEFAGEEYQVGQGQGEEEWSFDEQPELPLLQQRESPMAQQPFFEQNNPYLMQAQVAQESQQNKINYLQTKLSQNLKRQDEINKLMQIKLDECRKFIPNEKAFQEILQFFRQKLNMDEEYGEDDEKEIENFLKRKGLTDHRRFQNIYKIMHFEMELDNTRKIIQRICKRLTEFENP